MDLNIENYTFEDLLHLFNLEPNFSFHDLKQAYKIVYKAHPDKSGLEKDYFIFLRSAVEMLRHVKEMIEKEETCVQHKEYFPQDSKDSHHGDKQSLVDQIHAKYSNPDEFQHWFNKQFEQVMGEAKERISKEDGYDEWLRTEFSYMDKVNQHPNLSKQDQWKYAKQYAKESIDQLVVYTEPMTLEEDTIHPSNSSLHYEDIKRAHTESVVPVFDEDVQHHPQHSMSYEQYKNTRTKITPMTEEESIRLLHDKREKEQTQSAYATFDLLQQQRHLKQKTDQFWSNIQRIGN